MARTAFGRWVRDRLRRALGVSDLAARAEAAERATVQLAAGVDALNTKLTGLPGGVEAVGGKLNAVAGRLDAVAAKTDAVAGLLAGGEPPAELARRFARLESLVSALPDVGEVDRLRAEVDRLTAEVHRLEGAADPRTPEFLKAADEGRLVKLDYPPSYDFRARWGYSRPSHAGLASLFAAQEGQYRAELGELVERLPHLKGINRHFSHDLPGVAGWVGGPVNMIDTALLYHFVAKYKPKTYLEIGSGLSTLFASRAVKDHHLSTRLVSIDPNPRAFVDGVCDEVIRQPFEVGDLSAFASLEPGDIVFMDGSHRTFPNSDVTVFMLDVLPYLKPGVIVHVHDIVLPDDYPQMFVEWYWNEQYILAAYLIGMGDKIDYLMPSYYATRKMPGFTDLIRPVLDWWGEENADMWQSGGSIWFTHRHPPAPTA